MDSILNTVKKSLGLSEDYYVYDEELIMHINTALGILNQIGVGPESGYSISDSTNTWSELLGESNNLEMVKSYISLKVKRVFDSSSYSSSYQTAMDEQIKELESRINMQVD